MNFNLYEPVLTQNEIIEVAKITLIAVVNVHNIFHIV